MIRRAATRATLLIGVALSYGFTAWLVIVLGATGLGL